MHAVAQDQTSKQVVLNADVLTDAILAIKDAMHEAYPQKLPACDPVSLALEATDDVAYTLVRA
jgi:hypothetical protein